MSRLNIEVIPPSNEQINQVIEEISRKYAGNTHVSHLPLRSKASSSVKPLDWCAGLQKRKLL